MRNYDLFSEHFNIISGQFKNIINKQIIKNKLNIVPSMVLHTVIFLKAWLLPTCKTALLFQVGYKGISQNN